VPVTAADRRRSAPIARKDGHDSHFAFGAAVPGPWTTIYSTTTGTGGIQTLPVTGTGRYIRMYGTARATQYGYSLWEFQVYAS
jgi:hypothetical protein